MTTKDSPTFRRRRVALELVPRDRSTEQRLTDIESDLTELDRLIEDVLTAARLDTARLPVHAGPLELQALLLQLAARAGDDPVVAKKTVHVEPGPPLEVTADELPGGSVTVELGGLSRDTVELRDGSTLLGDVISMSMTEVVVRVDGKDQAIDRNQVKKVMLVERMVTQQPTVTQPAAQPK